MARRTFLFISCLLCVVFTSVATKSNISVILRHCDDYPDCYESPVDQSSQKYHKSLVKLLSSGVNQFIWVHVGKENGFNGSISDACEKSLKHVWKSVISGNEWAFQSKLNFQH